MVAKEANPPVTILEVRACELHRVFGQQPPLGKNQPLSARSWTLISLALDQQFGTRLRHGQVRIEDDSGEKRDRTSWP